MLWIRSLHVQLVLIPTSILLLGLAVTVGSILLSARARVEAEVDSSMRLGRDLVTTALRNVAGLADPASTFGQIARDLPRVRHVSFILAPLDDGSFSGMRGDEMDGSAPAWFGRLLTSVHPAERFPVVVGGNHAGEIRIVANPANEVREIWDEIRLLSGLLFALWALIVLAVFLATTRALRPLRELAAAFSRLERGDFGTIAPIRVPELRRIGFHFNSLVRSLQQVTTDNRYLMERLLSLQEAERKELARELHDEFGPSLFAIRAETSCIIRLVPASGGGAASGEILARARSITELADGLQKINYRMLDRLRPLVLEQLGLHQALRQLAASWQQRYPDINWSLDLPAGKGDIDDRVALTIYRVVQECAINVVRHAGATKARIVIETAGAGVKARVQDNGQGLPPGGRFGFGLLGSAERVRQLGGVLAARNDPGSGAVVEISIPVAVRREAKGGASA
jgi:two-component system sensor histidine kinase UhpB